MTLYPEAEWVPWRLLDPQGRATYYDGLNVPVAVVLHTAEGYESTIRAWAAAGEYGRSWHFTICDDGRVLQHLEFADGGYHASITAQQAAAQPPIWSLWRGPGENVNYYTIGIEHTGFHGDGFLAAQRESSRKLCRWLAAELNIAYDRDHFPPHADIDLMNRVNDFDTPAWREVHYEFLFEEENMMTAAEQARLERIELLLAGNGIKLPDGTALAGDQALAYLDAAGVSLMQYV